ncbi:MAG: DUF4286 family protein [Bacteroidaceae bacterium]|nr:DUF4286 family protein [Bacteroidaceae bacterium]
MLIYNTTYNIDQNDARNFVIWMHDFYIPQVTEHGTLKNPRMTRILSHKEESTECFSVQWEVEDTRALHHWHVAQNVSLQAEMMKLFKDKVVAFSTLMEVIE